MRQLFGRCALTQPDAPQIFGAAARAHIDDAAAIAAPHRPGVLLAAGQQTAIGAAFGDGLQPQLGLIDMRRAVAPPLAAAQAARVDRQRGAVGRGRGLELGEIFLTADLHRRAACGRDPVDIRLPPDIGNA
ncbi:hypothetical protein D9M73_103010 [compost metagenome]